MPQKLIPVNINCLNPHMDKMGSKTQDLSTVFLATNFTRKIPENSVSIYASIFKLGNIYHDFT